ncbi:MAG: hypothetical protein QNJ00_03900 [Woeseiaceae bacterium]|nr:hypothetical protein [Woeseiaceae bacterium]
MLVIGSGHPLDVSVTVRWDIPNAIRSRLLVDENYVSGRLTGDVSEIDLKAARIEMNAQLAANDCRRLLVDATDVSQMQSATSDFAFTS